MIRRSQTVPFSLPFLTRNHRLWLKTRSDWICLFVSTPRSSIVHSEEKRVVFMYVNRGEEQEWQNFLVQLNTLVTFHPSKRDSQTTPPTPLRTLLSLAHPTTPILKLHRPLSPNLTDLVWLGVVPKTSLVIPTHDPGWETTVGILPVQTHTHIHTREHTHTCVYVRVRNGPTRSDTLTLPRSFYGGWGSYWGSSVASGRGLSGKSVRQLRPDTSFYKDKPK